MKNEFIANGKIVEIIDEHMLIINAGTNEGIQKGDIVKIIAKPKIVKDPDTKQIIEEITMHKKILEVKDVCKRVSICKTKTVTIAESIRNIGSFLSRPIEIEQEAMNIEAGTATKDWPPLKKIQVGDLVEVFREVEEKENEKEKD